MEAVDWIIEITWVIAWFSLGASFGLKLAQSYYREYPERLK